MAKLNLSLKGIELESPKSDYSLVPEGTYTVTVGKADFKETKAGGAGIILGYLIQDGEHKGKLIKDFINIQHVNPEVVRIGMQRIKTVAFATGHESSSLDDSDDLLNLQPFQVIVSVKEDGDYKNNSIKAILVTRDINATKKEAPKKPATMTKPWSK